MAAAVRDAIAVGYRHIDCARVYSNEAEIGVVLEEVLSSGLLTREDLWITGKLWNDMHGPGDVLVSLAETLRDLLQITGKPTLVDVCPYPAAIPQYHLGHVEKIERLRAEAATVPGLHLAGNYLEGVSINDCIRLGKRVAQEVIQARGA